MHIIRFTPKPQDPHPRVRREFLRSFRAEGDALLLDDGLDLPQALFVHRLAEIAFAAGAGALLVQINRVL